VTDRAPGAPSGTFAAAASAVPAVEIRGLRKRYGDVVVLDGLDLEVRRGELFALLGPNGAGKTTTVEILEGYRAADGGEVRVLGLDPLRASAALRPRLGLMLQGGGIAPQVRPRELLRLHAAFYADPADADALLDLVGLGTAANRRYRVLSGGERQRLSLALALVGRPELLVLDEPTAGMDPAAKAAVRELIGELRASGRTILLTTHELVDAERLADRVGILDGGRLIALGSPAEVIAGGPPVLRFRTRGALSPDQATSLAAALGATVADDGGPGGYRIVGRPADPGLVAELAGWAAHRALLLDEIRTTGGTLEERFLQLLGGPEDEP
jgi:ABC-2 type transport system ATP-binding protein